MDNIIFKSSNSGAASSLSPPPLIQTNSQPPPLQLPSSSRSIRPIQHFVNSSRPPLNNLVCSRFNPDTDIRNPSHVYHQPVVQNSLTSQSQQEFNHYRSSYRTSVNFPNSSGGGGASFSNNFHPSRTTQQLSLGEGLGQGEVEEAEEMMTDQHPNVNANSESNHPAASAQILPSSSGQTASSSSTLNSLYTTKVESGSGNDEDDGCGIGVITTSSSIFSTADSSPPPPPLPPHTHNDQSPYNLYSFSGSGPIRRSRPRRSIVHDHFRLNELENRYYCQHCPRSYVKTRDSSTGSLQLHLKRKHADILYANYSHINQPTVLHHFQQQQQQLNSPPPPSSPNYNTEEINFSDNSNYSTSIPGEPSVLVKTELLENSCSEHSEEDHEHDTNFVDNNTYLPIPEVIMSSTGTEKNVNELEKSTSTLVNNIVDAAAAVNLKCLKQFPADLVLGVIGGGNMAKAILLPLFDMNVINPSKVIVSGTNLSRLEFWRKYGCTTVVDNGKLLETSNVILWSVKPQMFSKVLGGIQVQSIESISEKLHISVIAGISTEQLEDMLSKSLLGKYFAGVVRVIRVQPNLGLRVKAGCSAYILGRNAKTADKDIVMTLFSSTGLCVNIDESQANAHGALIGCGLGFMFPLLEAMSDGAVKVGIPRESSLKLAAQVMKGAAELFLQEGTHPAVLKDSVCSPGGTTIAGIAELEKYGARNALISAVESSTRRNEELGKIIAAQTCQK